jgi:hypothetical protein
MVGPGPVAMKVGLPVKAAVDTDTRGKLVCACSWPVTCGSPRLTNVGTDPVPDNGEPICAPCWPVTCGSPVPDNGEPVSAPCWPVTCGSPVPDNGEPVSAPCWPVTCGSPRLTNVNADPALGVGETTFSAGISLGLSVTVSGCAPWIG